MHKLINKLSVTLKIQFLFLFSILIILFIYSTLFPIPTDSTISSVGIGAEVLDIGDRKFYLNFDSINKGGFLYPFILKKITNLTELFNQGITSKLWNMMAISITSFLSIINLFLIDKSARNVFGNKVAKIANWIYVICPYTFFYALSGGLTMYMMFGSALSTLLLTNSSIFIKNKNSFSFIKTYIYLSLNLLYLSFLRPTGSIYGIIIMILLMIMVIVKEKSSKIKLNKLETFIKYFLTALVLSICVYQLIEVKNYISFTVENFQNEEGLFFGIDRNLLRERLELSNFNSFNFKNTLYLIIWKTTDFVGGISDIRDTHSNLISRPLFPFLFRTVTGIFYIYPLNLLAFATFISQYKKLFQSGLILIIISSLLTIAPSILGVAMSRYLLMIYPPILICSANTINKIFSKEIN